MISAKTETTDMEGSQTKEKIRSLSQTKRFIIREETVVGKEMAGKI